MSAAAVDRELREYETIYILRSSTNGEEAERVLGRMKEVLDRLGGNLLKVDNWGRRKLAYPIEKSPRGVFVLIRYVGPNDLVAEIERNLGILDSVVRFQTILVKRAVSLSDYAIDEEELKFAPLEDEPEAEEPGLAQRLGLVDRPKGPRDGYGDYEDDDEDGDDADVSEKDEEE